MIIKMKDGTVPTVKNASGSSLQYDITITASVYNYNAGASYYGDIDTDFIFTLSSGLAVPVSVTIYYEKGTATTKEYTSLLGTSVKSRGGITYSTSTYSKTFTIEAGSTSCSWGDNDWNKTTSGWYYNSGQGPTSNKIRYRTVTVDACWITSVSFSISGSYYQIYKNNTAYKNWSSTILSNLDKESDNSGSTTFKYSKIKRLSGE